MLFVDAVFRNGDLPLFAFASTALRSAHAQNAEEADVLRDTCPRAPGPDLSRPLWRTLHRAAGDRDDAALGDAAGSGRAAWCALTDRPARSGAALAGNERGTGRSKGSRTPLKYKSRGKRVLDF